MTTRSFADCIKYRHQQHHRRHLHIHDGQRPMSPETLCTKFIGKFWVVDSFERKKKIFLFCIAATDSHKKHVCSLCVYAVANDYIVDALGDSPSMHFMQEKWLEMFFFFVFNFRWAMISEILCTPLTIVRWSASMAKLWRWFHFILALNKLADIINSHYHVPFTRRGIHVTLPSPSPFGAMYHYPFPTTDAVCSNTYDDLSAMFVFI